MRLVQKSYFFFKLIKMPQIFQVLRCYQCLLFQVHLTKKSNKWSCKVCGEKQSIKRHYGMGSAQDCRLHVQKLNKMEGEKEASLNLEDSSEEENKSSSEDDYEQLKKNCKKVIKKSNWSSYMKKYKITNNNQVHSEDLKLEIGILNSNAIDMAPNSKEIKQECLSNQSNPYNYNGLIEFNSMALIERENSILNYKNEDISIRKKLRDASPCAITSQSSQNITKNVYAQMFDSQNINECLPNTSQTMYTKEKNNVLSISKAPMLRGKKRSFCETQSGHRLQKSIGEEIVLHSDQFILESSNNLLECYREETILSPEVSISKTASFESANLKNDVPNIKITNESLSLFSLCDDGDIDSVLDI